MYIYIFIIIKSFMHAWSSKYTLLAERERERGGGEGALPVSVRYESL